MSDLPTRLRSLRRSTRMSQSSLAAATGLSSGYISLLESGQRAPSPQAISVLATALATTPAFLTGGNEAPSERATAGALAEAEAALDAGDGASARNILTALDPNQISHTHRLAFLRTLGAALDLLGERSDAVEKYQQAADEARAQGRPLELASISMWLVTAYLAAGALDQAVELGESSLAELRELNVAGSDEHLRLGSTVIWAMFERGDYLHASVTADELTTLAEKHGTDRGRGSVYWNAALIAQARGDDARSVDLAERALASLIRQDAADIPQMRSDYAFILLRCTPPRATEALEQLEMSHAHLLTTGWAVDIARNEVEQARANLLLGHIEQAAALANAAALRVAGTLSLECGEAQILLGDIRTAREDLPAAASHYLLADSSLVALAGSARVARTLAELADRLIAIGQPTAADDVYLHALAAARVPLLPRAAPLPPRND